MTVYVDDMRARYRGMLMCHMIADSSDELLAMADLVGVARRWLQYPGLPREHFDIALVKRALAVRAGAVEITWRQCGLMTHRREVEGILGHPDTALDWMRARHRVAADRPMESTNV